MDIVIDFQQILALGSQNPLILVWQLFIRGGWIVFVIIILFGLFKLFVQSRQIKFAKGIKYTLLAIDIPKENEQSPKAVESIFAHLHGAEDNPTWWEAHWHGKFQLSFSLELISVEGYIQFLVRTPEQFRDLVEAAFYAQYPEAEITQVEDYTTDIPSNFPDEHYEIYGTDLTFIRPSCYPIRTYITFEHNLSGELKDPMSALLETLSRIGPGEQIWLQLIVAPGSYENWIRSGINEVKKLTKAKTDVSEHIGDRIVKSTIDAMWSAGNAIISSDAESSTPEKKRTDPSMIQYLSPGEKDTLYAIESKITRMGFGTKFRFAYLGRQEVFDKAKGVSPVFGAVKQFNTVNLNGFKPDSKTKTKGHLPFKKKSLAKLQGKLIRNYKSRDAKAGSSPIILNIEELATLWHFPVITVKAPSVKKAESKRGEPPFGLPVERPFAEIDLDKKNSDKKIENINQINEDNLITEKKVVKPIGATSEKAGPPANLPFVD